MHEIVCSVNVYVYIIYIHKLFCTNEIKKVHVYAVKWVLYQCEWICTSDMVFFGVEFFFNFMNGRHYW